MQVVQDNHAHSVIELFMYQGVPVLVHTGGSYPTFITDDGETSRDIPYIEISLSGSTASYNDGRVEQTWQYASVSAQGAWHHGRRRYLYAQDHNSPRLQNPGRDELIANAKLLLDTAVAMLATIDAQYEAASQVYSDIENLPRPFTREHYEGYCARWNIQAQPDASLTEWGDFNFPAYSLEKVRSYRLHQWRAFAVKREKEARRGLERTFTSQKSAPVSKNVKRCRCKGCGETHPSRFTTIVGGDYCDDCL